MGREKVTIWTEHGGINEIYPPIKEQVLLATTALIHNQCPFFWIDIRNCNDLEILTQLFPVHPLTIEDISLGEMREKCESYDGYIFLSVQLLDMEVFYGRLFNAPNSNAHPETQSNVYMLLFPDSLVTLHWDASKKSTHETSKINDMRQLNDASENFSTIPSIEKVLANRAMRTLDAKCTIGSDWLAYLLMDEVVNELTRQCDLLEAEVDTIEELALSLGCFDQADLVHRIYHAHRRTTLLSRLILPKIDLIKALSKQIINSPANIITELHQDPISELTNGHHNLDESKTSKIEEKPTDTDHSPLKHQKLNIKSRTLLYLRDVLDHLVSLRQTLDEYKESLDRAQANFMGQADIEQAISGHELNITVQKLTGITLVIGMSVSISAIWGMNVLVPFQDYPNHPSMAQLVPFFVILLCMGLISIVLLFIGKRAKWL